MSAGDLAVLTEISFARSFHIGAPEDYDEWALLQKGQEGASQWAFKEFNK